MVIEDKRILREKRSTQRAPAPRGTMALLINDTSSVESFYVRDISEAGVLISNSYTREVYPVDSIISAMFFVIPNKEHLKVVDNDENKSCFQINQGKIVRSSFDQDSFITTYGISFLDINSDSKKDLTDLLEIMPPMQSQINSKQIGLT